MRSRAHRLVLLLAACSAPVSTPDAGGSACHRCLKYAAPKNMGVVQTAALIEASGLVASRAHPGVLWSHNDSGGEPTLYAIGTDGLALGELHLTNAQNIDWEDIALGPCAQGTCLFAADIGDNGSNRVEPYIVYRVPEPDVSATTFGTLYATAEAIELQYPGGAHYNAETLLIHPTSADLYVVHKGNPGDKSVVYKAPAPLSTTAPNVMTKLLELAVPDGNDLPITGGDIDACGEAVLLRSYSTVYLFAPAPSGDFDGVFSVPFARLPAPALDLNASSELQGEAVAWAPDSAGFYTLSEGSSQTLHFTGCR